MIRKRVVVVVMAGMVVGLGGCAWPWKKKVAAESPVVWFDGLVDVTSGERVLVREEGLTAFQKRVRERLQAGRSGLGKVDVVYLMEADVPGGNGDEGGYMAVYVQREAEGKEPRAAAVVEQYVEQRGHAPRADRFYERRLFGDEAKGVEAFFESHPMERLRDGLGSSKKGNGARSVFRASRASGSTGETVLVEEPLQGHPAAEDLVRALGMMVEGEGWVCRYERQIPLNAKVLYAKPGRAVVGAWVKGADLRVRVWNGVEATWYVERGEQWERTEAPPEEKVEKKVETAGGGARAVAMPMEESWRAEAGDGSTNVWHYRPAEAGNEGQWTGFVVPGMEFDTGHMHVEGGMLYAIHEGQLIAVPVPEAAR